MNRLITLKRQFIVLFLAAGIGLTSCNKDVPQPIGLLNPTPTGSSIGDIVSADANFSYLRTALTRTGLLAAVQNRDAKLTVFAPDNAAFNRLFAAMGLPQAEATVSALPLTTLAGILQYHVVAGQVLSSTMIPETFPNVSMPTLIQASSASPFTRLMNYPSRRGSTVFVDNIPAVQTDIQAANGVIHRMAVVLVPPTTSATIWSQLNGDANFSYLVAAMNRADLGLPASSKFATLLNTASPYANFTLFAPDNTAFNNLFAAMGLPQNIATIQALPIQTLIGIVAYHVPLRGVLNPTTSPAPDLIRVFSSNLPATATATPTFLNMLNAAGPRLTISTAGVKGAGNPSNATFTKTDIHVLNGVIHNINQVLMPQ